jgi:hypothetical protein
LPRVQKTCKHILVGTVDIQLGVSSLDIFVDHCIEVLRLNTQCYADIGLFTFYMVEGDPLAWPELNSKHVCRNFDKVRRWALDHSVGNMEVIS